MSDTLSYKFSIFRTIATAGVVFLTWYALSVTRDSLLFVHVPSFVFPFGICFFLMLGSYGTDYLRFIPASLAVLFCDPSRPDRRYAEMAKSASRFAIAAAMAVCLVGVISMSPYLYDPRGRGAGLACSMIPPFYAILASELFFALVYKAFAGSDPNSPGVGTLPISNILIPVAILGFMVGIFFMLLAMMSHD